MCLLLLLWKVRLCNVWYWHEILVNMSYASVQVQRCATTNEARNKNLRLIKLSRRTRAILTLLDSSLSSVFLEILGFRVKFLDWCLMGYILAGEDLAAVVKHNRVMILDWRSLGYSSSVSDKIYSDGLCSFPSCQFNCLAGITVIWFYSDPKLMRDSRTELLPGVKLYSAIIIQVLYRFRLRRQHEKVHNITFQLKLLNHFSTYTTSTSNQ